MSDLLKKLTILKDTTISIYTDIDFRRLYLSNKIKLINGKVGYSDKLTDEYLLHKHECYTGRARDKTYTNNWITYQNLTNAILKYIDDKCILFISIDEGSFDGSFSNNRWKANFELDISEIHLFSDDIERMFDTKIDQLFQEKEELRIQKEKDKIRKKLLE